MLIHILRASEDGPLESLSALQQVGVLGTMLGVFSGVIVVLFKAMVKSKDAEIAAANKRADTAEAARDRFEQKLDRIAERTQSEVLSTLRDASLTARQALEIKRGSHGS